MQTLKPIASQDRELFMDVLRGIAILGIFIANLNGFSWYFPDPEKTGPWLLPEQDHTMAFLHHMFIEGKFYSIFSLLFGWGIALQLKRAADNGVDSVSLVKRRLGWMLLFGAVHLMLWPGDIIFFYALLGFVLLSMRKLSDKALIITGSILILSPIALYAARSHWPVLNFPAGIMFETGSKVQEALTGIQMTTDEEFAGYLKTANWWEAWRTNIPGFFFRYGYLFFVSRIPKVLGIFLIGYALGRSGFYKNINQHKKTLYIITIAGFAIGLPANYMLAHYMSNNAADYWQMNRTGLYQTIAYALGVAPLALAYAGVLMLLFQRKTAAKIMSVVAPVGKMAFSNYLLQTIIGSIVFLGAGFNYLGEVGPVYYTVFVVLVFIGQIILSHWWLKYFNYGPVEYLGEAPHTKNGRRCGRLRQTETRSHNDIIRSVIIFRAKRKHRNFGLGHFLYPRAIKNPTLHKTLPMAKLAKIKTTETTASVDDFVNKITDEEKRKDTQTIIKMMTKASKAKPKMWGTAIIGFGNKVYVSPKSGREVDWMKMGFSPRTANLSLYLLSGLQNHTEALKKLGKYSTSVGCLYIKRLSDVDLKVLEKMIQQEMK